MSLPESEYAALRHTIASRATARMTLIPVIFIGWALLAGTLSIFGRNPATTLFSLAVLAAGFEAIYAMHVGVERIGRYLQVFYEGTPEGPKWETTAMAIGPALPGGGIDPLFTVMFGLATLLNLVPATVQSLTALESALVGVFHAALLLRLVRARRAAARQRAVDLESYRAVQMRLSNAHD
jgi:hypothetical protein